MRWGGSAGAAACPQALARDPSGAAILEFALVLPLLFLAFAGTVELGRALSAYHALEAGARAGARALARADDPSCDPACSAGAERAIELARAAIAAGTGLPPAAIRVRPDPAPPPGAVALRAELDLPVVFLGDLGFPKSWRMAVSPQEARLAE